MPYQTHWKEYCEENNTIYDSPTVEQFLNFLKKLFNPVLWSLQKVQWYMLYQHIPRHLSITKYFKGTFTLKHHYQTFIWDVQITFEYFRSLGDNNQISNKHLSHKLLILLLLLGRKFLNSVFHFINDEVMI